MLRDAAIARIQEGLAFRTDNFDRIVQRLQDAQRLLERGRTLPYFLLEENAEIEVLALANTFPLPTGFLREEAEGGLRLLDQDDSHVVYLEKVDYRNGILSYQVDDTDEGQPQAYALLKSTVQFWPATDIDRTLTWSYYKSGESLSTNIENSWLDEETGAPEVLWSRAGMMMAQDLFNDAAKAKFQEIFFEAYSGMLGDTFQREIENKPLYMNGRL